MMRAKFIKNIKFIKFIKLLLITNIITKLY